MINSSHSKTISATLVLCIATAIPAPAQTTFTSLFSFDGSDGEGPSYLSLIQGPSGSLYGTASGGDLNCNPPSGCGVAFSIAPSGRMRTLHIFEDSDGNSPLAGLVLATDGKFYGTTQAGGDLSCNAPYGCGTVFGMTPDGAITTLHTFESTDGFDPVGALIQGVDGDLYGTTADGGPNFTGGTIFKITPKGALTTIYDFCVDQSCTDGNLPTGALLQATDGNFYGTTTDGGNIKKCEGGGCGTVFRLTPAGKFSTVYRFNYVDGQFPQAGLVQARDGALYGTTTGGGANGYGVVFKIAPGGALTTLHSFDYFTSGAMPYAPLIQATDGKLYGTTAIGNVGEDSGTVFSITTDGLLETLYRFCQERNCTDGEYVLGGVLQGTNGTLYGTTTLGGTNQLGTIFSLNVSLPMFIRLVRNYGSAGAEDGILGQGLTGTSSVSFNGTPASFSVLADTFMKVTVPTGATTGYVTVTTPSETLTSNVPFQVIK